jgi:membrane protein required for colicin V production
VPGSVAVVPYLPVSVPDGVRYIAAFIIVFSIVWLTFSFASIAAAELIKAFKLGWLDKALGAFFGLIKGMVIVTVLVLLAGLTVLPRETFWKEAVFSTPLEAWVKFLKPWLPVELSKRLKYD